jgi:hypothetical protein
VIKFGNPGSAGAFNIGGGIITGGVDYPYNGTSYPANNTAGSGKALYPDASATATWGPGGVGTSFSSSVDTTIHVDAVGDPLTIW